MALDTPIKVGQCARCKSYVWSCRSDGCSVAADMTYLETSDAYVDALLAGRTVYEVLMQAGRAWKLRTVTPQTIMRGLPLVASHGCGAHGMDSTAVQEVEEGPQRPSATFGGHRAGSHPQAAPEEPQTATQDPEAAAPANHRPSDLRAIRCSKCKKVIARDDPDRIQIAWPVWQENEMKVRNGRTYEIKKYEGYGTGYWAIHEECSTLPTADEALWPDDVNYQTRDIDAWAALGTERYRRMETLNLPEEDA